MCSAGASSSAGGSGGHNRRVSGIFISYRRQDAAPYAGRLRSDLAQRYGESSVFLDIADLTPGANWTEQLHQAVDACDLMLVVIGPRWLQATDAEGRRRVDDPEDFIRSEIAAALRLGKRVVPVLVGGASMPPAAELPDEIAGLARRQAGELSDRRWDTDLARMFEWLDRMVTAAAPTAAARPHPVRAAPRSAPVDAAAAPSSFFSRLGQAFDVLLGRAASPAPSPAPAPPPKPVRAAPRPAPSERSTAMPALSGDHEVFVSYANEDQALADQVVAALERAGPRCWIAHRDIPPGVPSWAEPIVTAIANSRLVLVLLTAHSIPSVEVMREVTLAADEKIPLLPVTLDATPLSPALRYFFVAGHRLDLAQAAPEDQVLRILPAVQRQLPQRS